MGVKTSGAHFQRCMIGILGDQYARELTEEVHNGVLQYSDDELTYADGEEGLLDGHDEYLGKCDKHNVKLSPKKFVLFALSLAWGGKQMCKDAVDVQDAAERAQVQR